MGSSETDTPSKLQPKTSSAQEQAPAASSSPVPAVYPDWSGFQAYSPIPPHGFFHSPVASSPQAHPYMWGAQHLMSPYGTPPPYVMYPPPGGLYAHPSLPPGAHPFGPYAMPSPNGTVEVSGSVAAVAEVDGKSSEGKERSPIKRSRGSLGSLNMITGKTNNELGKTSGASANGAYSQSGESGTEGSSDSDANSQNDSEPKTSGQHGSLGAEASHNGTTQGPSQNGLAHAPSQTLLNQTIPVMTVPAVGAPAGIAGPTTNLNIGMDYWGTTTPSAINSTRGKNPATSGPGSVVPGVIPGHRENLSSELWMQDEREVKRQKRKQSNRESARRSRLRKQAECEELAQRVESMKEENNALRAELDRFRKEYDKLLDENTSLKERVEGTPKAAEGTMLEKNNKHPGNGGHQHTNSDARADTMQNGR